MRKNLLITILVVSFSTFIYAQDTLFHENFETGGTSFTLNTTDVSSTATGYNYWVINNQYTGGSGSVMCLGLPLTFNVPNTTAKKPSAMAK